MTKEINIKLTPDTVQLAEQLFAEQAKAVTGKSGDGNKKVATAHREYVGRHKNAKQVGEEPTDSTKIH